jgi:hypothetical protein
MAEAMTREEARAIAYGDRELLVEILLQLSARIEELERQVALLTRDSSNSSQPPSSDGPAAKPRPKPPVKSRERKQGARFTFLEVQGVEPANNAAERALRPAVQWRKICFATSQTTVRSLPRDSSRPLAPACSKDEAHSITCSRPWRLTGKG